MEIDITPKMLRETLCVVQQKLIGVGVDRHRDVVEKLIKECDRQ